MAHPVGNTVSRYSQIEEYRAEIKKRMTPTYTIESVATATLASIATLGLMPLHLGMRMFQDRGEEDVREAKELSDYFEKYLHENMDPSDAWSRAQSKASYDREQRVYEAAGCYDKQGYERKMWKQHHRDCELA